MKVGLVLLDVIPPQVLLLFMFRPLTIYVFEICMLRGRKALSNDINELIGTRTRPNESQGRVARLHIINDPSES